MSKKKKLKIEVCVDSYCAEHKGKKVARKLQECIEEKGLDDGVRIKKCDCLGHCKKGPVVKIPGKDLVFEGVKPGEAQKILESLKK